MSDVKKVSYVFVNGEGSLYDQNDCKGRVMIKFMGSCIQMGKTVFLLNSGYDLKSKSDIALFQRCISPKFKVLLREPFSLRNFQKHYPAHPVGLQPDVLFGLNETPRTEILSKLSLSPGRYLLLAGNSNYYRPDRPHFPAVEVYVKLIKEIERYTSLEIVILSPDMSWMFEVAKKAGKRCIGRGLSWRDAFGIFSGAKMYISGRYHPSILAALAAVPTQMISANHCKMNGLNELLGNPQPVIDSHSLDKSFHLIKEFIQKNEDPKVYETNRVSIREHVERCKNQLKEMSKFIEWEDHST